MYLARTVGGAGFQRLAAVKVLHPWVTSDPAVVARFLDAALASARIAHPNVVAVQDVGADDGVVHAIMDYVEGDTLAAVAAAAEALGRRIPLDITLRVVLDALAGLHAAHEVRDDDGELLGAIHGDVSFRHVLLGVDGSSRLIDFGVRPLHGTTETPEDLSGLTPDRRSDVYAAGRMLWEALTLEPMFPGLTSADRVRRIQQGRYRPIAHFDADTPPVLDAICQRALQVDPARRYPTAAAFADAIEENLRGQVASRRTVASFIQGVAAARIAREREAVRAASKGLSAHDTLPRPGMGELSEGPGDISGMRPSTSLHPRTTDFAELSFDIPYANAPPAPPPPPPEALRAARTSQPRAYSQTPLPLELPPPVADGDTVSDEDRARFALPTNFQPPPRVRRHPMALGVAVLSALAGLSGAAVWLVLHR